MLSSKYHLTRQFGMQHTENHKQTFFMNHRDWKKHIETCITKWMRYFDWMVDIPEGHTLLLVRYEDLKANVTKEVKRMLEFLHYRDTGLYVCVYVCMCALDMYVCMYVCITYVCMLSMYVCVYVVCAYALHRYACIYIHTYVCMCVCMCVCVYYVCLCITCVCMYFVCILRVHICIVLEKIRPTLHCYGIFK